MAKLVKVSATLLALLEETANEIMGQDDGIHAVDWRNENQASAASNAKGGVIHYETDHDWKIAFFVWYYGSRSIADRLPRD